MASIKLFRGAFGHVSVLNAASDLVTHAHPEVHVIIWLEGDPGRMTVGDVEFRPGPDDAVCVNSLESDILGSDHLMFGSNFPIEKLWTSHADLVAAHRSAAAGFSEAAQANIFEKTAAKVYRLG
jgi:hypothetical protein